jgi:hypothetical protein
MMTFIFWVGLIATTLLMLAAVADEVLRPRLKRLSRLERADARRLVPLSLARAGALRIEAVPATP